MKSIFYAVFVCFTIGLSSCGGGSSGTSTNSNSKPITNDTYVPTAAQYLTPVSAYLVNKSNLTLHSLNLADGNSCFVVVVDNSNKQFTTSIPTQGDWWSSATLSFSLKNTCSTAQSMTNLRATINGFSINGNAATTVGDVGQNGSPWLSVAAGLSANNINLSFNTPECSGDYCAWAKIPANGVKTFVINVSLSGKINTINAQNITLNNSPSPTPGPSASPGPSPTTSPTPGPATSPSPSPTTSPIPLPSPTAAPVVGYGQLVIALNARSLLPLCPRAGACQIKINVLDPSHQMQLNSVIFDPESGLSVNGVESFTFTNVLPGNYTLQVDTSTLPSVATGSSISILMAPSNGEVSVPALSSATGQVTFLYNQVPQISQLTVNIESFPELAKFSALPSLSASLRDLTTNEVYNVNIPLTASYTFNNLPANDNYELITNGIADAYNGVYYQGVDNKFSLKVGANNQSLTLVRSTDQTHNVQFTLTGGAILQNTMLILAENGNLHPSFYVYIPVKLEANHNYVLLNAQTPAINIANPPSGYTSTYQPKVIDASVSQVSLVFSKVNGTYDFIAPFKDYNNKITLTVQGVASAKSLTFTSNFQPKTGWGNCFGNSVDNLKFYTTKLNNQYQTTITGNLVLTNTSCDIMGTDSGNSVVLAGVTDPQVYSVNVDNQVFGILQPCLASGCKDLGNSFINAGYYAQWSVWGRKYDPNTMPFTSINDIIYAFVGFNPADGSIKSLDSSADSWGFSAVSHALLAYPYMQAHLSFGGWTNNGVNTAPMFNTLASSTTSMNTFANQAILLMRQTGFTGLDIDWEWWSDYANNQAPAQKMLAFYTVLRNALNQASLQDGKKYTLTIAVNGGSDRILALQGKNVDGTSNANPNAVANFWQQVAGLVDRINIMNYDYHGSWDTGTPAYFQANYDFQNVANAKVGVTEGWSIKSSVNTYIANGVPAKKIVVGIPLYARTMVVASATNGGLLQNVVAAGFGDYEAGVLDYKCVVNPVNNPITGCGSSNPLAGLTGMSYYNSTANVTVFNQFGKDAMQPWAYSPSTNTFVTYDDPYSAVQKANAVKAQNLAGTMFWELDGDAQTVDKSIVNAVKNAYN